MVPTTLTDHIWCYLKKEGISGSKITDHFCHRHKQQTHCFSASEMLPYFIITKDNRETTEIIEPIKFTVVS